MRRQKDPIELASDIGAKAFDLHCYGDARARLALREVARVNPEMLAWLRDRLLDITQQSELMHARTVGQSNQPQTAAPSNA